MSNHGCWNEYTIVHHGRTMCVSYVNDDDSGEPWKESDGHGPVSDLVHVGAYHRKRPGQIVMSNDRSWGRLYDFEEATKTAKRDNWGLSPDALDKLRKELKREPTRKQIARQAVLNDFEYLRGWCNDDWHWMGVIVRDEETGVEESLWGIKDNAGDYIKEVVLELAEQCYLPTVRALIESV